MAGLVAAAYWLLTRGLSYDHVYASDLTIGVMLGLFILVSLVPAAWRSGILLGATLTWHGVFTPLPVAAAIIGSSAGVYLTVRSARLSATQRRALLAPLAAIFIAAAWAESVRFADEWTVWAMVYQFGWDVMILRLVYFIAEGAQIRRGVPNDRLDQFLVFMLFFPFTLNIVLMSYVEFLGSRRPDNAALSRVRGVAILALAVLKYGTFVALGWMINRMRFAQAAGTLTDAQQSAQLWAEVLTPYVRAFCFISMHFDLGTAWARLFGWNIESAFRWPLLARNMKELWVRWNVYYRQALVNLFFYPFIRRVGDPARPARHAMALVVACLLTFLLSAALHMVLYDWQPALATAYFILQSIPVCYVLVMEYLRLQQARKLRQRAVEPDPLFTPVFIAVTFCYQALLHYCMADDTDGTVHQRFIALVSLPVQLLSPLWTPIGWTALSVLVGVGIARRLHRRAVPMTPMPLGLLVRAVLLAGTLGLLTAWPARSIGGAAVEWAGRQPLGAVWELNAGVGLAKAGRTDEAICRLEKASAFASHSIRAQEELIAVHMAQQDRNRALDVARRLVKIDPANASALNVLADAALRAGRLDEAIDHLRIAFEHDPQSPVAARNLARTLALVGRVDEAVEVWNRAAAARPGDIQPRGELAELFLAARRYSQAMEILRSATALDPADERIAARLSLLLAACPDHNLRNGEEAMKLARRISRDGQSGSPLALSALAAAHAELGQFEEAQTIAQRARHAALAGNDIATARQIENQLAQYAARRPWRFPS